MYKFCLLFSYLIKVVVLLYFICCYQHVLVNKDIHMLVDIFWMVYVVSFLTIHLSHCNVTVISILGYS